MLLYRSFSEALAEVFQLEVTGNGAACRETPAAGQEALVRDNRAGQACGASRALEGFLCAGMADSATCRAQRAASVAAAEEGDPWKVLGPCSVAAAVGVPVSGEHRSQLLTQELLPPSANRVS